ncbi:MAG: ParB/RepB/Spo0J family partition protein [Anaerolineae bacterium]
MAKKREQEQPPLSRTDLLGGENQAIQRLIGAHARTQLANVHIADIDPNPFNPRQVIEVTELVESMREHGFIGALDGRLQGRRVQLAYGARRLAAAQAAGIEQIPVYLHADWDDNALLTISLVENVQREDLSPLETALTILQMNDRLGWPQRDIARRTGKSHSWVRDMMALAAAGSDVQSLVRERPDTARHARFIAQLADEDARQTLAQATRRDDLTVDQVYRAVQAIKAGSSPQQALLAVMRRAQNLQPADQPPNPAPAPDQSSAAAPGAAQPAIEAFSHKNAGAFSHKNAEDHAPTSLAVSSSPSSAPAAPQNTTLRALETVHGHLTRLNLDALRQEAQVDPAALQAALEAIHAALARIETALRTPGEATSAA